MKCRICLYFNALAETLYRMIDLPSHPPVGMKITLFGDQDGDVSKTFDVAVTETQVDEGTLPQLDVWCTLVDYDKDDKPGQQRLAEQLSKVPNWDS